MSIRVVDLHKRHPGSARAALAGINLEVRPGQVAAVLGPSGAGKTSLLRCLVGLDGFDSGYIDVDGVRVTAGGPSGARSPLLGRVGLVFQAFELFPHLSVLDNCTLALRQVKRVDRQEAEARALELLSSLGLSDFRAAHPESLSGGQRQRVAIARALAVEPGVLLYDEPTSALDPSLKHEVGRTLRRVATRGVAQILVTHDLQVAREAADVVFVLEAGRVAESGAPEEVLGQPQHPVTRSLISADGLSAGTPLE